MKEKRALQSAVAQFLGTSVVVVVALLAAGADPEAGQIPLLALDDDASAPGITQP